MDQQTALKLFEEGGVFVFLNVPEGTVFGIDMKSWNTGEKFRGVKMIPPGIHYIFYSAANDSGDVAPRTGFFHNFRQSEMLVKKWDEKLEGMSEEPVSEEEIVRLKDNIKSLDGFLGPYPYNIHERWKTLSSNMNESLIKRLTPLNGQISSALELQSPTDAERPRGIKKDIKNSEPVPGTSMSDNSSSSTKRMKLSDNPEDAFLPKLKVKDGTELRLTKFPERNYPEGSSPSEITRHSLDSSYVLDFMVSKYSNPMDLIGELEFAYICFLVGHSLEAFDHWKKLFVLFCSCEVGLKKHRKLYDAFIDVIDVQIKEVPEEFLADIVTNNNIIYVKLRNLFRTIQGSEIDGQLKSKTERFQQSLTQSFYWDFEHLESEDEDEAPVIIHM